MHIREVVSLKDIADFHTVPFGVYEKDCNWIPHIKQDIEKVFNPKTNRFFSHGKAIRWVLFVNNVPVGRVAAFINKKTSNTFKQPTGGMGFFECINNKEAAFLLFDTCKKWLKENKMEAMDGPINFGEKNQFWGLLTENFSSPNTYGMNYNPRYYLDFFVGYGFKIYYEQYLFSHLIDTPLAKNLEKKALRIERDPNYTFSSINKKNIDKYAEDFRLVYNAAWGGHDNFKEMEKKQALKMLNKLKPIMDENVMFFGYYKKTPIAFYISIPELNEIFKHVNGNMNWWGKIKFFYYLKTKQISTLYSLVFGVSKRFQGKGVDGAIIRYSRNSFRKRGRYKNIILTWIGDFNPKMLKIIESLGAKKFRTLATFRKLFDENAPFERCPIIE